MKRSSDHGGRLDEFISRIYRGASSERFVPDTLASLADQTASDMAVWCKFDRRHGNAVILYGHNIDPRFISEYNGFIGRQNPWLRRRECFETEGQVYRGAEIVPVRELVCNVFYKRLLAPHAVHHTLHIVVAVHGDLILHVILGRRPSQPEYRRQEIDLSRAFAFHCRSALELHRDATRLKAVRSLLSHILDSTATGVAIIDQSSVLYASDACRELLAAPESNTVNGRHPQCSAAAPLNIPPDLARALTDHDHNDSVTLIVTSGDASRRYVARIQPITLDDPLYIRPRQALALTIRDIDQNFSIDESLLRLNLNLTNSEARVCALLANGGSVDEISKSLAISALTVRTHLQRIFKKTGATRQAEVTKFVLNVASRQNSSMIDKDKSSTRIRSRINTLVESRSGSGAND